MNKRIATCLTILLVLPLLTGCLAAASVEDYGFVLTLGIDKGEQYTYNVSFFMQNEGSVSESQSQSSHIIVSCEGESIFDAISLAEASLPYRLNFARTDYIIFSQEIAELGLIKKFFSVSFGMLKIRTSTNLLLCTDSAADFLNGLKYAESINVSKLEESLVKMYKSSGIIPLISLGEFMSSLSDSRYDAILPLCSVDYSISTEDSSSGGGSSGDSSSSNGSGSDSSSAAPSPTPNDTTAGVERQGGMQSYAWGGALFNDEYMVGVLTASEVQLLLLTKGKLGGASLAYSRDDGTSYIVRIKNTAKPDVKIDMRDTICITYDILISARLELETSLDIMKHMRSEGSLEDGMKRQIQDDVANKIQNIFTVCRELDSDAFGIGRFVSMQFSSSKDWENFDFSRRLRDVYVAADIDIELEDVYVASYMD